MARIIRLRGDGHREVQELLPWYVAGRLDPPEHAKVEAHLAECPECRAETRFEGRLSVEMSSLPADVEQSWARMRQRMGAGPWRRESAGAVRAGIGVARRGWSRAAPLLGWALAAPAVLLLAAMVVSPSLQPARYHALGARAANPAGNVVVIFHPDITERSLRETLEAEDARIVDGPTAAGAYVLRVPASGRAAALIRLRSSAGVALAQPIDAGVRP